MPEIIILENALKYCFMLLSKVFYIHILHYLNENVKHY